MTRRRWLLTLTTSLIPWLAACSAPQGPLLSAAETGAALHDLYQAGAAVASSEAWNQLPADALAALGAIPLPAGTTAGALPRGVYAFDQFAQAWVKTGESDDLELDWLHEAVAYRLTVDWDAASPTTSVTVGPGESYEVPSGAVARFTEGGVEVGELAIASGWAVNNCGFDESAAGAVSGYLGDADASLTLTRLGFTIADSDGTDAVTAEAEVTARAGGESLSAYLELTGNGEIVRDTECAIVDFTPTSGSVALGVAVGAAGEQHSLDFHTAFADPQYQGDVLSGIRLNGDLRLDGILAFGFTGTLNDHNGNGIPGDELLLTFADAQSLTLEEFLSDQLGWGPLAVMRLMVR